MTRKPAAADTANFMRMQRDATATLMGQLLALEGVVAALIATHPDPELLRAVWLQLKPELVDALLEGNPAMYGNDLFRETFHEHLARYERGIQSAAERGE